MKPQYIFSILAPMLMFAGCAMESPFQEKGQGKILKSALEVKLNIDENIRTTKASDDNLNLDDFVITFTQEGKTAAEYKYSEMPEIVILSEGEYTCTASYGENLSAAWDSPYYYGVSKPFNVVAYEITGDIDPIVCRLCNVKVTVAFDESLASRISDDAVVNVKLDTSNSLDFTEEKISKGNAGFFKHGNENTLVAVFSGTIDGSRISTTKSINDVQNGSHYKLTFRLHDSDNNGTGSSSIKVLLDTSVTSDDFTPDGVTPDDEEVVIDPNEHPHEGEVDNPDNPTPPDEPVTPGDNGTPPSIEGVAPLDLDIVNDGDSLTSCIINVHSSADGGFLEFTCDIESEKLNSAELETMGLASHLDLINPGETAEILNNLGFPVNVGGQQNVKIDISGFLVLLKALGTCQHDFILYVKDANGETTKTLKLNFN